MMPFRLNVALFSDSVLARLVLLWIIGFGIVFINNEQRFQFQFSIYMLNLEIPIGFTIDKTALLP